MEWRATDGAARYPLFPAFLCVLSVSFAPLRSPLSSFGLSIMKIVPHADIQVWREDGAVPDQVAEEVPVALRYNGQPHAVMMCTPGDLDDFVLGFSLTEGIVAEPRAVADVRIQEVPSGGMQVDVRIPEADARRLADRGRGLVGRSGCGLCGVTELDPLLQVPRHVPTGVPVARAAIRRALDSLRRLQPLNAVTGATHAAGWASADGLIVAVREDVGRHNALDKLIGHLLRRGQDCSRGFCVVTSRASYEMVSKAAVAGMPMLVAISAPTAFAVRLAEEAGMTLIGFARGERCVIYTCPARVVGATAGGSAGA